MTERLNVTTAEHTTAEWTPTGETMLQLEAAALNAKVHAQVRVSPSAPWMTIGTVASLPSDLDRIIRLPRFPSMRLVLTGNTAGSDVKVWDNE